jgi:hypothetical protein
MVFSYPPCQPVMQPIPFAQVSKSRETLGHVVFATPYPK